MNSEIEAAIGQSNGCENYFDETTQSDIAYCASEGADGYTESGVWISWQSVKSNEAVVDYGRNLGVAGFFTFDTSMDSHREKYKFHKAIEARMSECEVQHDIGPGPCPKSFSET